MPLTTLTALLVLTNAATAAAPFVPDLLATEIDEELETEAGESLEVE